MATGVRPRNGAALASPFQSIQHWIDGLEAIGRSQGNGYRTDDEPQMQ